MMDNAPTPKVLLVEDTKSLALTYAEFLRDEGYDIVTAETGKEAQDYLDREMFDLVLLDLHLPDMNGSKILKALNTRDKKPTVVVITAHASVNVAVEAMQHGAYDFLVKPFPKEKLLVASRNALKQSNLEKEIQRYQRLDRSDNDSFVGTSLAMQNVYRMIDSAAGSKASVFITGESGTGKEVCARALHNKSPRKDRPFVALNCGAIPENLIESEIFGHVRGAFTGASSDRDGAATRANTGTLFLDEICEMHLDLQVKLLRFLQTGTFTRVGGDTEEKVDIRIICATNRDPFEEVQKGTFREDLYYRLHVIPIHMPPLRVREKDVLDLAQHYLKKFSAQENKTLAEFSPQAQNILGNYHWPGNVRELVNVVQSIVVMNDGEVVDAVMLPPPLDRVSGERKTHPLRRKSDYSKGKMALDNPVTLDTIRPLWQVEKQAIENALRLCGDNIPQAAAKLEVNPSTLYRKKAQWDGKAETAAVKTASNE